MKVLLSAYGFAPHRGSEGGLGWNWACALSRYHQIHVLAPGWSRELVEGELRSHPALEFRVHYVSELVREAAAWPLGMGWLHHYWWQWKAFQVARRLHRHYRFDIVHHVTYSTWRVPSFMGALGVPFVWGPIGGGQTGPRGFWRVLGWMGSLNEAMRSWGQWASRLDPFVNRTLRQANIILAANSATRDFFPQSVARKVRIMLIAGSQEMLPRAEFVEQPDPFRLLWVGYFTAWKGLPLLLEALAQIKSEIRTSLTIVGDGPESQRWRRLVCQLGLVDTVQFLGKLPHKDTLRRYQEVDAFVFTSLHDSSGNVLHEAMSSGLPLIVLDWAGPHDIVIENCGIKIRPESPAQVVQDLALSIKALARDPNRRKSMGEASRQRFVGEFDWNKKAKEMTRIYELVRQR